MRILREWSHRLWGALLQRRRDSDLELELRLHRELAAKDAQRRGLNPTDSARAARLKAGGTSQAMDALRDQRGGLDGCSPSPSSFPSPRHPNASEPG